MKAIILAGGLGTRLSEETELRPKPMVEIGGMPVLWHIMKTYSHHGIYEFIICCGYKGYVIKEYFNNYFLHNSDISFDMTNNAMEVHSERAEPWKITLVDTGLKTMTGGRLSSVKKYIEEGEDFCFTYGDGVSDINISSLIEFHKSHGKLATVTSVNPPVRFGMLNITSDKKVESFIEKPTQEGVMVNGGFFVLSSKVFTRLNEDPGCVWEEEPLSNLASDGELMAFQHNGFWQPMDTLREKIYLNDLWDNDQAPWKVW